MRVLLCGSCGAPLDAPWDQLVVVCEHCGSQNLPGKPGDPVPPRVPVDGRPRVSLGGRTYVVESRLGVGDSSRVFRARWAMRLGELAVLKVLQASADADRFRSEWRVLEALQRSRAEGASHFVTRLPVPIAHGLVESDGPRLASVFGWKSGFVHTLTEIGEVHADGVPGEVAVWLLKRLLELLGFVHRSGYVHGAVTPDHVLVHPFDHGATLVGWTCSVPWRRGRVGDLPARSRTWSALYGGATAGTPQLDVQMACRCVQAVAPGLPEGVAEVVSRGADGRWDEAWVVAERLTEASRASFGPPAYHPLPMPGWSRRLPEGRG